MFKVGDRVQAAVDHPSGSRSIRLGYQGTVCYPEENGIVNVGWDQRIGGHDCCGNCKYGHGWRVHSYEIHLVEIEDEASFDIEENAFMSILKNA